MGEGLRFLGRPAVACWQKKRCFAFQTGWPHLQHDAPSFVPKLRLPGQFPKIDKITSNGLSQGEMPDGWVDEQVAGYRLTEGIILSFLKNDCNFSGTNADFDVKVIQSYSVCRHQPLTSPLQLSIDVFKFKVPQQLTEVRLSPYM